MAISKRKPVARKTILKLDFDHWMTNRNILRIASVVSIIKIAGIKVYSISCSRTRRGHHVRIYISRVSDSMTVAIQACMGSDWTRESFNIMRVRKRMRKWNILFSEKMDMKDKVFSKEIPDKKLCRKLVGAIEVKEMEKRVG